MRMSNRMHSRFRDEDGQAILILGLAMSFFLIAVVGLGVDGSNLYSQRTMAQTAADAAAQAAMISIYNGTNSTGGGAFSDTKAFTCSASDARTPCKYAAANGFGTNGTDTVSVSFPSTAPAGVALTSDTTDYPVDLVKVTITRPVTTFLVRLAGPTSSTVEASATAAIVSINAPVPILVNHPTMSGAMSVNGGGNITICGGPHRSMEVNSSSTTAITISGAKATVNLQHAGPPDPGNCTTGDGGDFGTWGGPASVPFTFQGGSTGQYLDKASWLLDPLRNVQPPSNSAIASFPTGNIGAKISAGTSPCPSSAGPHGCEILSPGTFSSGISLTNITALFQPGIYYIPSTDTTGFSCGNNCNAQMLSGTADPGTPTGTGTGWDGTSSGGGMMIYNAGSGQFNVSSNGTIDLIGASASSTYQSILYFESHTAAANNTPNHNAHSIGGGGSITLQGTLYMTNTRATMLAPGGSGHYQELDISGNGGGNTTIEGEIIVDALGLSGGPTITMNLNSSNLITVSQVALVQ